MKKIELDVTTLIETVKKEDKLFYPVIMHILLLCIKAKEDDVFYQQDQKTFLKTTFHPVFETFYKNYVFDSYNNQKQINIPKRKICFALYEDQKDIADFVLYPFEEKNGKTILSVLIKMKTPENFETECQKAVFAF